MNVYATYTGAKPQVVNGMLWIPGETYVIDDRLLQQANLGETEVTTRPVPAPSDTSVILEPGTPSGPAETATGTDQVVVTQSGPKAQPDVAEGHSEPTTPRTKKG